MHAVAKHKQLLAAHTSRHDMLLSELRLSLMPSVTYGVQQLQHPLQVALSCVQYITGIMQEAAFQ